ncbi:hypothetical protein F5B17DRAFT_392502 [Nemania serpens]|nr:hypothetical protein F5B17DRAFT_392502 [Nemania serpens]
MEGPLDALRPQHEADQVHGSTGIPTLDLGEQILRLLGNLDKRLENLDQRLERLEQKVDSYGARSDARFNAIDARFDRIDARFDRMDAPSDAIDARFDSMELRMRTHIAANESNNIARMRNRKAARFDDRLAPLFAISTNEKIENFPQTLGDIDKLDEVSLDFIFNLLGQPSPALLAHKRRELKRLAGISHRDFLDDALPQPMKELTYE